MLDKSDVSTIKVEKDVITTITLCGNTDLNILHSSTMKQLHSILNDLHGEEDIRVLIITGQGSKSFCSGADIKELSDISDSLIDEYVKLGTETYDKIENFHCPTIAAVNGYAFGAGFELALACDIRFLAKSAKIGQPAVKHGLIPPFGGLRRLPQIVGLSKAKEIIFSAETFNSTECLKLGLVNRVYDDELLSEETIKFAENIVKNKSYSVNYSKNILNSLFNSNSHKEEMEKLSFCLRNSKTKETLSSFFDT